MCLQSGTAGAGAALALDVEFGRGLRVRKEARAEAGAHAGLEEPVREGLQRALEIAETDALVDDEPFDLREHRRVGGVEVVAAVDAAGRDDPHRRRVGLHEADLHPRRVRAEQTGTAARGVGRERIGEVQRVLHVARRVLGRHVERLEVVPVVLEFGAFDDLVAHAEEDVLDALADLRERVAAAERRDASRQRDVDRAGRRRRGGEFRLAGGETFLDGLFEALTAAPRARRVVGGRRPQALEACGQQAVLAAEEPVVHRLEVGRRPGVGEGVVEIGAERLKGGNLSHGWGSNGTRRARPRRGAPGPSPRPSGRGARLRPGGARALRLLRRAGRTRPGG